MWRFLVLLGVVLFASTAWSADASLLDNLQPTDDTSSWWGSLSSMFSDLVADLLEMAMDVVLWVFDSLLGLASFVLGLMPSLEFMHFDWSGLAPIMYFLGRIQIDVALSIYGAGLAFRLTRKLMTLGQW